MADPRDPLGKLRRAIQATHDEVRNATAYFEVARPAFFDKDLATRLNGTRHIGHAAQVIRGACLAEALLAAARLWDEGDGMTCRRVRSELQNPAVTAAIVNGLSLRGDKHSGAQKRLNHAIEQALRIEAMIAGAHSRLRPLRNKWLAHRDLRSSFARDGGGSYRINDLRTLIRGADLIARRADALVHGSVRTAALASEVRMRREDGERFWRVFLLVDRSPDD